MRIGFVGLGKLGLPVALALSRRGHDVVGFDVDPARMRKDSYPHRERGPAGEPSIESALRASALRFGALAEVVEHAELIFVAVQTPHGPRFEGATRLPDERQDFDYSHLTTAIGQLSATIERQAALRTVAVISTVVPGTIRREILPLLGERSRLCYNPLFVAMGSVMRDFLEPELVLVGSDEPAAVEQLRELYASCCGGTFFGTSIENAEVIKMAYNTFITTKICFANTLMELCHRLPGASVDTVTDALSLATERLLSPRYLRGGMGDGGSCHPRDNVALSWQARQLGLSFDWFEVVMRCRERQTEWLAQLAEEHHLARGYAHRRIGLYGRAFKAGTNLVDGSPARLLASLLLERGFDVQAYDPHVDRGPCRFDTPGVYLIATRHPEFADPAWSYPADSVVIDPWRYVPPRDGVEIVPVGIGPVAVGALHAAR
jgi:UDPglucose 6-dehydrogenase